MKYIVFNCFGSFIRIWMFKGAVNLEREGGGGGVGGEQRSCINLGREVLRIP